MSTHACKLLTSGGTFYVAYDTVISQFISKALPSLEEVAEVLGDDVEGCKRDVKEHVYDMRRKAIHNATLYLSNLKLGKTLRVSEMCELNNFLDFLNATVAPHQWDYPEISDEVVKGWVDELGLRKLYPDYDDKDIVGDCSVYPAIQEAPQRRRFYPEMSRRVGPRKKPRVAQNKLAGRYVSQLALIANAAGPEKSAPEDIVARFYEFLQTNETGGQN